MMVFLKAVRKVAWSAVMSAEAKVAWSDARRVDSSVVMLVVVLAELMVAVMAAQMADSKDVHGGDSGVTFAVLRGHGRCTHSDRGRAW